MPDPRTEWAGLLERRILESGLSSTQFATSVLRRDPRTIRRWRKGERPIPAEVGQFLEQPQPAPWPREFDLPPGDYQVWLNEEGRVIGLLAAGFTPAPWPKDGTDG